MPFTLLTFFDTFLGNIYVTEKRFVGCWQVVPEGTWRRKLCGAAFHNNTLNQVLLRLESYNQFIHSHFMHLGWISVSVNISKKHSLWI